MFYEKIKKSTLIGLCGLITIASVSKIGAVNTTINQYSPKVGTKLCAKSTKLENNSNIYAWYSFGNGELASWPGIQMTKDENNNYCFTVSENQLFDKVIFNNGVDVQTIDLSTLQDSSNIINDYIYSFESNDGSKYRGTWYVYDKTSLTNEVSGKTSAYNNYLNYKKDSYNLFNDAYNYANEIVTTDYDYNDSSKLIITESNGTYSSEYTKAYDNIINTYENLVERVPIIVNNSTGGNVTASYSDLKTDENYKVNIIPSANTGYELSKLNVSKITGYAESEPILSDEQTVTNNNGYNYVLSKSDMDSIQGLYVSAIFKKKIFKLTFTIDSNGKLNYVKDGNTYDINDVIEVEYDDNFIANIIANEGFELKKVTVDGIDYNSTNNKIELNNISSDKNITVTFSLKSYILNINDKEYTYLYGTSINDIKKDLKKEGYSIESIKDEDGSSISDNYIVKSNDTLKVNYKINKYNVKIDGKVYELEYNTTYKDLLKLSNKKEGYELIGLEDTDGNTISEDYYVDNDIELVSKYKKIDEKKTIDNPFTYDGIKGYVIIFILSLTAIIGAILYKIKRTKASK